MAYVAEHPTNSEFATFADGLWWGVVTLTTVGYGDIVPITEKGRIAATFLMLTGVTTLGLIAGTLASAFGLSPTGDTGSDPSAESDNDRSDSGPEQSTAVLAELAAMREQLATIERRLVSAGTPPRND
jgi:voltage-gated potassium channel